MKIAANVITVCTLVLSSPASAVSFAFSYTTESGAELSGRLRGDLQADNNLVLINGFKAVLLDGVRQPLPGFQLDLRALYTGDDSQPIATSLDGSFQNFCQADDGICSTNYFGFVTDVFASPGVFIFSAPFGPASGGAEAYVAANWRLVAVSDVPEPAGWAMLITGFGLAGAASRRGRALAA